jgi:hypothetical protein
MHTAKKKRRITEKARPTYSLKCCFRSLLRDLLSVLSIRTVLVFLMILTGILCEGLGMPNLVGHCMHAPVLVRCRPNRVRKGDFGGRRCIVMDDAGDGGRAGDCEGRRGNMMVDVGCGWCGGSDREIAEGDVRGERGALRASCRSWRPYVYRGKQLFLAV